MYSSANQMPLAAKAETFVTGILRHQGWLILARNFRRVGCEIDIIAFKKTTIIFVEVKFRARPLHTMQGFDQIITRKKRKTLERGARCFLQYYEKRLPYWENLRFDLALVSTAGNKPCLRYISDF